MAGIISVGIGLLKKASIIYFKIVLVEAWLFWISILPIEGKEAMVLSIAKEQLHKALTGMKSYKFLKA
ncbi:hypothetical protein CR513_34817, partial [Mucuna pruriens]